MLHSFNRTDGAYPEGSLIFDSAGNLYGTTSQGGAHYGNGTVFELSPGANGRWTETVLYSFGGPGHTGTGPERLIADGAGNLYASNYSDNTIEKFTPDGVASVFASSGLNEPIGLAFDSAGNLYAANLGNNTIEKFTSGGVGSVFASGIANGVNGPEFLAFTDDAGQPLPLANQAPEPTSALLLLGSGAMLLPRRRRAAAL